MDLFATVSRLPFSVLGPHRSDTCTVDRLNYKYTVIILVIFSIIVSNKQFSSDHIACWVPGHFTRSYEVYSNNICWVSNTYYVAAAETLPLDENKKKTRVVKVIRKIKKKFFMSKIFFFMKFFSIISGLPLYYFSKLFYSICHECCGVPYPLNQVLI
jgi:hypothetical protein